MWIPYAWKCDLPCWSLSVSWAEEQLALQKNRRVVGRMWREQLVCFKLVGLLFGTVLEHGRYRHSIGVMFDYVMVQNMILNNERDDGIYGLTGWDFQAL